MSTTERCLKDPFCAADPRCSAANQAVCATPCPERFPRSLTVRAAPSGKYQFVTKASCPMRSLHRACNEGCSGNIRGPNPKAAMRMGSAHCFSFSRAINTPRRSLHVCSSIRSNSAHVERMSPVGAVRKEKVNSPSHSSCVSKRARLEGLGAHVVYPAYLNAFHPRA